MRDGEDYVVHGTKHFISHADVADFIILFAATGSEPSIRGGLEILWETEGMSVRDGYRILAGSGLPAHRAMLDSQDAREGAPAFAERHRPVWRGR